MQFTESETLELKSSFGEWKEIIISLCAFANRQGGTIVVGFDDDANFTDLRIGKRTLEDFVNKVRQHTDPVLYPSLNVKTYALGEMAEISIPKSDYKPVFAFGRAYTRVGKSNVQLSANEIRLLVQQYKLPDFDRQVTRIKTTDFKIDTQILDNQGTSKETILQQLQITRQNKLIIAGYLCFVRENKLFSNAIVKAARFKGNKPVTFIDMQDFSGGLLSMPDQIMAFIKKHINMGVDIAGQARRVEQWDYPLPALREAIINALVHRDYQDAGNIQIRIFDDALEIWSPGILPKEIDIQDIENTNRSIPRNPKMADIFYHYGLIEKWGTGLIRILEYCRQARIPEPLFTHIQQAFVIKFLKKAADGTDHVTDGTGHVTDGTGYVIDGAGHVTDGAGHVTDGADERENLLLQLISGNKYISLKELSDKLHVSKRTVLRDIEKLKKQRRLKRIGNEKSGYWQITD